MKKLLKKILPDGSGLYKFLSKHYRSLYKWWLPPAREADHFLKLFAQKYADVFFIQIGSNDGVSNDPLNEYITGFKWRGILVEPVKFLFDKLQSNYLNNNSQLIFENAAISKTDGTSIFYRLKESNDPDAPFWYNQIGSFNKQVIMSHKDRDDFESLILSEEISTISFSSLIEKYTLKKVDLVHIDTEGYDYEILKLIDFNKLEPAIVIYEYVHLSLSDFINSLRLMKLNGFEVFTSNLDIVCIKSSLKLS